jgi:hypothetical protein
MLEKIKSTLTNQKKNECNWLISVISNFKIVIENQKNNNFKIRDGVSNDDELLNLFKDNLITQRKHIQIFKLENVSRYLICSKELITILYSLDNSSALLINPDDNHIVINNFQEFEYKKKHQHLLKGVGVFNFN